MSLIAYIDFTSEQISQIDTAYKNKTNIQLMIYKHQIQEQGIFPINLSKKQIDLLNKGQPITIGKAAVQKLGNLIKNILIKNKVGGLLPILAAIPFIAGAAGIAGGISGVVSAVNQKKHQNKMEEETKRHNKQLEEILEKKGQGLYMRKGLKKA